MKNQDVTDLDYDAIMYDKPAGEVLFKAAFSGGFPSRYKPNVVMVEVLDDVGPRQFTAVFALLQFGCEEKLNVIQVKHYQEERF